MPHSPCCPGIAERVVKFFSVFLHSIITQPLKMDPPPLKKGRVVVRDPHAHMLFGRFPLRESPARYSSSSHAPTHANRYPVLPYPAFVRSTPDRHSSDFGYSVMIPSRSMDNPCLGKPPFILRKKKIHLAHLTSPAIFRLH